MYCPPHFREDRMEVQHALIRAHPLGLIVTAGAEGLNADSLPFLIDPTASRRGTLIAHLARANDHWRALADAEECLIVFQGPHAYLSPSWYATKRVTGKVVPTWNYITVHAWGRPRVIDDVVWLRDQVVDLTEQNEASLSEPWRVEDAPETFVASQLRGIVGLEVVIDRIEGKWKMSQNRSEADRAGVVEGLRLGGGANIAVADCIASATPS